MINRNPEVLWFASHRRPYDEFRAISDHHVGVEIALVLVPELFVRSANAYFVDCYTGGNLTSFRGVPMKTYISEREAYDIGEPLTSKGKRVVILDDLEKWFPIK